MKGTSHEKETLARSSAGAPAAGCTVGHGLGGDLRHAGQLPRRGRAGYPPGRDGSGPRRHHQRGPARGSARRVRGLRRQQHPDAPGRAAQRRGAELYDPGRGCDRLHHDGHPGGSARGDAGGTALQRGGGRGAAGDGLRPGRRAAQLPVVCLPRPLQRGDRGRHLRQLPSRHLGGGHGLVLLRGHQHQQRPVRLRHVRLHRGGGRRASDPVRYDREPAPQDRLPGRGGAGRERPAHPGPLRGRLQRDPGRGLHRQSGGLPHGRHPQRHRQLQRVQLRLQRHGPERGGHGHRHRRADPAPQDRVRPRGQPGDGGPLDPRPHPGRRLLRRVLRPGLQPDPGSQ